MKKIITILFLIYSLTTSFCKAQTYHPLPTKNAYWTVNEFVDTSGHYDDIIYMVNGDTIINSLVYTKVYRLNDVPTIYDTVKALHCFMRQDSASKKIWFIRHYLGETKEKLGYDLSANIGDTVSLPAFDYGNIGDSVFVRDISPIDSSILNNGAKRLNYIFRRPNFNGYQIDYIEGICDQRSTFPNKFHSFDAFHQNFTVCVEIASNYAWPIGQDSTTCGFNYLSISENESSKISLYPNPASNFINISFATIQTNSSLTIYNILGTKLYEACLTDNIENYKINLESFSSGIYLFEFKASKTLYYKKIVINH